MAVYYSIIDLLMLKQFRRQFDLCVSEYGSSMADEQNKVFSVVDVFFLNTS